MFATADVPALINQPIYIIIGFFAGIIAAIVVYKFLSGKKNKNAKKFAVSIFAICLVIGFLAFMLLPSWYYHPNKGDVYERMWCMDATAECAHLLNSSESANCSEMCQMRCENYERITAEEGEIRISEYCITDGLVYDKNIDGTITVMDACLLGQYTCIT